MLVLSESSLVLKFDFFGKVELLRLPAHQVQKFNFTEEVELHRHARPPEVRLVLNFDCFRKVKLLAHSRAVPHQKFDFFGEVELLRNALPPEVRLVLKFDFFGKVELLACSRATSRSSTLPKKLNFADLRHDLAGRAAWEIGDVFNAATVAFHHRSLRRASFAGLPVATFDVNGGP